MADGVYDPEATRLRLQMMLRQGFLRNPDGSMTPVAPEVAKHMLEDIEAGSHPASADPEDGLDYEVPGL